MDSFEINEIAIILAGKTNRYLGEECEILSSEIIFNGVRGHNVDIKGRTSYSQKGFFCPTYRLRKKKPPEKEINWVEKLNLKIPTEQKVTHV